MENNPQFLFIFCIIFQGIHIIVPFVDCFEIYCGGLSRFEPLLNPQGMNFYLSLNPFQGMPNFYWFPVFFTPALFFFTRVMTLGIVSGWYHWGYGTYFLIVKTACVLYVIKRFRKNHRF